MSLYVAFTYVYVFLNIYNAEQKNLNKDKLDFKSL